MALAALLVFAIITSSFRHYFLYLTTTSSRSYDNRHDYIEPTLKSAEGRARPLSSTSSRSTPPPSLASLPHTPSLFLLDPAEFRRRHFDTFATVGGVSPELAFAWANRSVPFFSMPSRPHIERAYYFRWKLFLEHVRATGCGGAPVALSECRLATTRNAMAPDGVAFETDHQGTKLSVDGAEGCVWGDELGVSGVE